VCGRRPSLLKNTTPSKLVVGYRRFETPVGKAQILTLEDGTEWLSQNVCKQLPD
jgi:hypothetical protein